MRVPEDDVDFIVSLGNGPTCINLGVDRETGIENGTEDGG